MSRGWEVCPRTGLIRVPFFGSRVTIHRDILLPLQAAAAPALYTRYGKALFDRPNTQGYNCREARGQRFHSEHSHGTALDIRPPANPYIRTDGAPKPKLVTDFAAFGVEDGAAWINSFKRAGFRWGGDWSTDLRLTRRVLEHVGKPNPYVRRICDPMHFEFAHDRRWIRAHREELEWLRDTAAGRRSA